MTLMKGKSTVKFDTQLAVSLYDILLRDTNFIAPELQENLENLFCNLAVPFKFHISIQVPDNCLVPFLLHQTPS